MYTPPETQPKRKSGCLRRGVGCLVLLVAFVVVVFLSTGLQTRIRNWSVQPGMTVAEVLKITRGCLVCMMSPTPPREAARSMRLSLTEVVTLDGGGSQSVSGSEEAARVVNDEMARSAGSWSLRVGYITMSPRRMYFTVEFGADGRVASVSDVEWGRLD